MLADDIVGCVALDPLSSRIPVRDAPFRIEHEDRVIGHALDEQPEPPLRFEQGLLRLPLLGHVAGDFGEADQLALLIVDPVDDDAGPEARPVLAHAPALTRIFAFAARGLEHPLRHARLAVLFSIEFGEMLADDLFGLEALDALGTRVPAGHEALRVQHVDRIIDDGLDEQLEGLGRQRLHFV